MKSFHEALQVIAQNAGLPSLELNADGFAEIILGSDMISVFLYQAEESQLELSTRLPAFDGPMTDALAQSLLRENATRTMGRFALEQRDRVVLGHRIELATATPDSLMAELNSFARQALLLEHSGAAALMERAEKHSTSNALPDEAMIRL